MLSDADEEEMEEEEEAVDVEEEERDRVADIRRSLIAMGLSQEKSSSVTSPESSLVRGISR